MLPGSMCPMNIKSMDQPDLSTWRGLLEELFVVAMRDCKPVGPNLRNIRQQQEVAERQQMPRTSWACHQDVMCAPRRCISAKPNNLCACTFC